MRRENHGKYYIWLSIAIYFLGIAAYAWAQYKSDSDSTLKTVDERLYAGARGAALVLGDDFHDAISDRASIPREKYLETVSTLSDYASAQGLKYVYTWVREGEKIFFASTSATQKEIEEGNYGDFFDEYYEATDKDRRAFSKITYMDSSDRWGSFRSVLIPLKSKAGKEYVVGADIDITYLESRHKSILLSCLVQSFYLLMLATPFLFVYTRSLRVKNEELEEQVKEKTLELKRASDAALEASAAKSAFLSNMSHEVRTPLNAVIGFSELLKASDLDERQGRYASLIQRSSKELLHVINAVLDLTKIESGKLTLESVPFQLIEEIESFLQILKPKAVEKGIEIFFSHSPEIPQYVEGDPLRIKQIMGNLVMNSIKFTNKGGKIQVIVATGDDPEDEGCRTIQFSVRDTGIGIAAEKKELIFLPFEQADSSTTRQYGGTGLGLSICRNLVAMMGGEINVISEQGKGSTFSFNIRLREVLAPLERPSLTPASGNPVFSSLKVLFAEDVDLNYLVACELFSHFFGIKQMDRARDGAEAVKMTLEQQYDVIFMDIQMPQMDGLAATRELRHRGVHVPVIALSAHAFSDEVEKAMNAGMDEYLRKPLEIAELSKILSKYARQKNHVQARHLSPTGFEGNDLRKRILSYFMDSFGCTEERAEALFETSVDAGLACLREIEDAARGRERELLRGTLHRLKGILLSSGLDAEGEEVSRLERLTSETDDFESVISATQNFLSNIKGYYASTA